MTQQQKLILTCPDGTEHSAITDEEAGERLCEKCGIVLEERIAFVDNKYLEVDKAQNGTNVGLTTLIKKQLIDHTGKSIKYDMRENVRTLQKWDYRIRSTAKSNDKAREELVSRFCEKLGLSNNAKIDIHRYMLKLTKDKLISGRQIIDLLSATIYYVCKQHDIPKSMAEIGNETNVSTKRIYKMLRLLNVTYGTVQKVQPLESFATRYATRAGMPSKYDPELLRLIQKVKEHQYHAGKSPAVIIASLLRWISIHTNDFERTMEQLSEACDTNDVSIRQTMHEMIKTLPLVWVY